MDTVHSHTVTAITVRSNTAIIEREMIGPSRNGTSVRSSVKYAPGANSLL